MRAQLITCIAALAVLCGPGPAIAKPPELKAFFPAGAARGQTLEVTASGTFDAWPVRGWATCAGVVIAAGEEKGKLRFCIPADAEPGLCWIRLYSDEGASALRPFVIGTLPEIIETEPNDEPKKAQRLEGSRVVVNGRLTPAGDVDAFALELKRGQTLVASLLANHVLASPMDAVLQVTDAEGFVLAHNDDEHEFDPQVAFEVPRDGVYLVRTFAFPATPDSSIRLAGAESFVYRLTLTTGGFIDHAFPLAVSRAVPSSLRLAGWNIDEYTRNVMITAACDSDRVRVARDDLANTVEIQLVDHAAPLESEPNDAGHPQRITLPSAISGHIEPAGDIDAYQFEARKGAPVTIRVESRALGQPLDPVLRVSDLKGKTLSEADDTGRGERDAILTFNPPEDGSFGITIRDLHGRGGFRYAYLLHVQGALPEVRLALSDDRFTAEAGKPLKLKVGVQRTGGYAQAVEIAPRGLPEGIVARPVVSEPGGPGEKEVTLEIEARESSHSGSFQVVGKTREEHSRSLLARSKIAGTNETTADAWLTVTRAKEQPAEPKK